LLAANPTLSWVPSSATAVPMSSTSMAILAALFMMGGIWILSKKQKKAQSFLIMALLMTGVYNFTVDANATTVLDGILIEIKETRGNDRSLNQGPNVVVNKSGEEIRITIDHDGCPYAPLEELSVPVGVRLCSSGLLLSPLLDESVEVDFSVLCVIVYNCP